VNFTFKLVGRHWPRNGVNKMKKISTILLFAMVSVTSFASTDSEVKPKNVAASSKDNIVNWIGYIDSDGDHNTKHNHSIEFVRKTDGKSFDVVDSPELEEVHCKSSKKLLVEINAKRTPRVLFWGNNLIVNNYKILKEVGDLPHRKYKPRPEPMGGRSRL
jgi:hypothetical protein